MLYSTTKSLCSSFSNAAQVFRGFFAAADGGAKVKPVEQNHFQHVYPVE